jgi:hypothetical protein
MPSAQKPKSVRGAADWRRRPLDDELGEALRAELIGWPAINIRPMMGTLAFLRGKTFLGCYVNRALVRTQPGWVNRPGEPTYVCIRLRSEDAAAALARPEIRKSRLDFAGWVEIPLSSRRMLEEAVRWFGRAYERPPRRAAGRSSGRKRG